ncbi:DUF4174 domain-containing protein [Rhizobium sp. BK251]|uniref:DUF4174 domain-containing protein n=1 Tax=Rhizobium sp. BK251 TaxID=2512125 RepID=UPI001048544E|nr:DUF4174 domain-containing protein [Rhizobium sp. BK251]TCL67210.1 uncharacterized protein DUF4174 [Rhizobium sp. BK251]
MLKSLVRELIGASPETKRSPDSLRDFRGRCSVLAVFEDSDDERPVLQEQLLKQCGAVLERCNIAVLKIAGGGVFQLLDEPYDIDADEIRDELKVSSDDFEVVLVDMDGTVRLRSRQPIDVHELLAMLDPSAGQAGHRLRA